MDGYRSGTRDQKKVNGETPITESNLNTASKTSCESLGDVRMFGELSADRAKLAYRTLEAGVVEAMLPCLLFEPPQTWQRPGAQLEEAKKLFVNSDKDRPDFDNPIKLSQRKSGDSKAGPPLEEREDARLKAYWLFPNAASSAASADDIRGLELATRNYGPNSDLKPNEKAELAILTLKILRERFGGNEPPTTPAPWEQINERAEFNDALNILSDRYKWSVIREGVPLGERLPDYITDENIRVQADEQLYGALFRRYSNLKITPAKLSDFIGGELTGGNIPEDHVVITQSGLIDDDPFTAAERRKNGTGLTRDDAINALFFEREGVKFGDTVGENERFYNDVVSDARKNPIVDPEKAEGVAFDPELVRDKKVDPNKPNAPRPEPGFLENHPILTSSVALGAAAYGFHELYALVAGKQTISGRIKKALGSKTPAIIGPLIASAGLGGELALAEAVPRNTESGQSRMAEGLDSRTNIVRAEGVSTVPGAAGVLAQAREVGAADLKTMTADRAKLLVSNNPADQKAAEQLREVVEALEGKKGPALEKTARESVSECARRSSEGRLRRGAGLVVGLEMISLAAIEAYQYIYPESAKEQPSTKVKPVPIR